MLSCSFLINKLSFFIISKTFNDAPTIDGANVLEKRYGLDFCLNISTISFLPDVNPPEAPPNAFPRVPVIISILPITFLFTLSQFSLLKKHQIED